MKDRLDEERMMLAYLLGTLREDEQARLEERFLRDPDCLDRLKSLEQDLNDEYVRDEMSVSERQLFDARIAASPEWRRRTVFAKALMTLDDQLPLPKSRNKPSRNSFLTAIATFLRPRTAAVSFSLYAAVVLALVACVWLFFESSRLRSQLRQLAARQEETEQREGEQRQNAAAERARSASLASELENERRLRQQLEMHGAKPLASSILSFVLAPGVNRGAGETVRLPISKDAKQINLQLFLEGTPDFYRYRAELRSSADLSLLTSGGLIARQTRLGKSVRFVVPANLLSAGGYEVVLSGADRQGRSEPVGSYYFTVAKP